MKPYLLILALMTTNLKASAPAFPNRPWTADTAGLTLLKDAHSDHATATIEVTATDESVIPLIIDNQPNVGAHSYALFGEVKHEQVGGTGFLETWTSVGGNKFFSRSLAEEGPMAKLTGSGAWREFMLPMNLMGASAPVQRIEMNVVLPNGGKVWLRNLRLQPMNFGTPGLNPVIVVTVVVLPIAITTALLIWRSRRRRSSENEINRMMAADA